MVSHQKAGACPTAIALSSRCLKNASRLRRGELEGVELRDERLHVARVKAATPPEARAFADGIEAMLPAVRITEVLHDVCSVLVSYIMIANIPSIFLRKSFPYLW